MANLISNPDFETNTTGWTANGSTISRDTTTPHGGVGDLKIVTNNVGVVEGTFSARTANGSMSAGTTYEAYAWVNAAVAAALKIGIEWHDAADTVVGSAQQTFTGNGSYQKIDMTAVAPANTDHALFFMYTTAKQALTVFMDDVYLGLPVATGIPFPAFRSLLLMKGLK